MFCAECGAKRENLAKFCHKCGVAVTTKLVREDSANNGGGAKLNSDEAIRSRIKAGKHGSNAVYCLECGYRGLAPYATPKSWYLRWPAVIGLALFVFLITNAGVALVVLMFHIIIGDFVKRKYLCPSCDKIIITKK
jgi:ribosomal protein L40E